jgi:two-component system response regulator HydG
MTETLDRILVVDDDVDTAELLRDALQKRGFQAACVYSAAEALGRMEAWKPAVVLTDIQMPEKSGIDLCAELRVAYPDTLVMMLTGVGNVELAVNAIRAGAYDFLNKPVSLDALGVAIARTLDHARLAREVKRLRTLTVDALSPDGIIGSSEPIRSTIEMVHRIAPSDATVLITGESGTGKELIARALHTQSPRRDEPFIAINCAAVPANLLESELFGHVRGAFTDAKTSRPGLFAQAGNGTLMLDEIGEMPIEMQVKLLRVLQERSVRPVGGDTEYPVTARVVAATNRDLEREVRERRFREDLYYRINVVAVRVPALRERPSDILLLAQHFLHKSAARNAKKVHGISAPAARYLREYDWPGNVRELENCIERAVAMCEHDQLTVNDLPEKLIADRRSKLVIAAEPSELITLDEMERRYVRHVLAAVSGNKSRAADILGIDRRSVYRRLEADPTVAASRPAAT